MFLKTIDFRALFKKFNLLNSIRFVPIFHNTLRYFINEKDKDYKQ